MSLEWPEAPTGGLDQSRFSRSHKDANGEHPENAHLASPCEYHTSNDVFAVQKCAQNGYWETL